MANAPGLSFCVGASTMALSAGFTSPERFASGRSLDELLEERRQFHFPPQVRLVEVRRQGSGEVVERHFLPRNKQLAARKAELVSHLPGGCYLDVDPVD